MFPPEDWEKAKTSTALLLFNIPLQVLASTIKQEK